MANLFIQHNGQYEQHLTDFANLNNKLNTDGVAVIPNVLNNIQISNTIDQMHNWLYNVWSNDSDRIDINNQSTYKNFYKLLPLHSGMLQHHNISHQQFVWDIRSNESVYNVFSNLYPNEKLLTSFDGVNFVFPPELTNRGFYRGGQWFHTDQSAFKPNKCCIQGMVNLYDVDIGDGTLAVLKGSNNYHQDFFNEFENKKSEAKDDWYKISDNDLEWFINKGCSWSNVLAPAGSMILWDSRTFHMAIEPQKNRPNPHFRFVIYVCMLPRSGATINDLQKKIHCLANRRMTSHWAYKVKMFPQYPRTYGAALPELDPSYTISNPLKLTNLGLELIGL